ncbi:UDP-N-acetylglucosamine 1-carboxyvinyltransferase [Pontibacter sp. G13]|uniref:UDP-N-acetylglucosamine 1-carboxyvinyltransferase n=1 Tax=Pontibacter sp. G13 TaxID=3074898 RepID=UPI00288A7D1C|nr:UDP-N-acetylglucosamine 1-carboxyvinyltransferase [Pontibacter sp. G13]WNJ21236.1 UDP-N-acetylglucosamine 1-carboxyvinyltransferase [Pontibacter sp. G13]
MQYFQVEGGHKLTGEITPQGAKNEALQILCATLLTAEPVTIHNIPDIVDVNHLIDILATMGVSVKTEKPGTVTFQAADIDLDFLESDLFWSKARKLRGSIMLVGPLLARFGKAFISRPGGDKIGRRRLDTHFWGFQQLGAEFEYREAQGIFCVKSKGKLKGTYMLLDEASVTGTANLVMAAALAEGKTTIYHAACEPYLQQLCKMLNRMGAKIQGIGSNLLTIEGVDSLGGTDHTMLSDMIEVGSFIGMAAMTQGNLRIKNAGVESLGIIPETFRRLGVNLEIQGDDILVHEQSVCEIDTFIDGSILTISDHPWPGLTPDLLSIVLVLATQCKGSVLIHQKMFESRLFFVDKLIDMGAQIILCDPHRATVIGLERRQPLRAISMSSPDIRAGVALLIAAMSAEGTSRIYNIEQIDRGYQFIENRLNAIGAKIERKLE